MISETTTVQHTSHNWYLPKTIYDMTSYGVPIMDSLMNNYLVTKEKYCNMFETKYDVHFIKQRLHENLKIHRVWLSFKHLSGSLKCKIIPNIVLFHQFGFFNYRQIDKVWSKSITLETWRYVPKSRQYQLNDVSIGSIPGRIRYVFACLQDKFTGSIIISKFNLSTLKQSHMVTPWHWNAFHISGLLFIVNR